MIDLKTYLYKICPDHAETFVQFNIFIILGDIFSCHAIDNPDMESEMAMLRQYGPDVSDATLKRLVSAFADLREMADQGLISYPYSTREVVNMVRHLQVIIIPDLCSARIKVDVELPPLCQGCGLEMCSQYVSDSSAVKMVTWHSAGEETACEHKG